MLDRLRRSGRMSSSLERPLVHRSFEAWTDLEPTERRAIQVCHPDWRGVRTATYAFRTPVVESPDFSADAEDLAVEFKENGVETLVVQAWPQGSAALLEAASNHGIGTRVVFHSSMAQHGTDAGESEAVSEALRLANAGTVDRIGFVKEGLAEVFRSLGFDAAYVPNRVPDLPPIEPVALGSALNIGILLDPYWRKNVTTQLGAVAILEGRAHVVRQPDVGYLEDVDIVEHGNLDWETFISLQAGMTLNFNVTLSECHPMSPMESYLSGVPCLVSATSALFREDPDLYELTTVADADNPRAIADKATQLLDRRSEAVDRARAWLVEHDKWAAEQFHGFASIDPPEHT